MTLGTLKLRLLKQFPGLDLDILDGFISDRYSEILQELPWSRLKATAILQTIAPYSTGTVAVTAGSANVVLTDGAWLAAMTGRKFRIDERDEFYSFTFSTGTTGTLDRAYEGSSATAAAYKIFQNVYAVPANCRILADDAFAPLERFSRGELNEAVPTRPQFGEPQCWAPTMDDGSTPPKMQVELYPIPDAAIGIPYEYTADASLPGTSSAAFLPWMEPATAMVEGVTNKILRTPQFKDLASASLALVAAANALQKMRDNEADRMPQAQMRLSSHYTSHRRRRYQ